MSSIGRNNHGRRSAGQVINDMFPIRPRKYKHKYDNEGIVRDYKSGVSVIKIQKKYKVKSLGYTYRILRNAGVFAHKQIKARVDFEKELEKLTLGLHLF